MMAVTVGVITFAVAWIARHLEDILHHYLLWNWAWFTWHDLREFQEKPVYSWGHVVVLIFWFIAVFKFTRAKYCQHRPHHHLERLRRAL